MNLPFEPHQSTRPGVQRKASHGSRAAQVFGLCVSGLVLLAGGAKAADLPLRETYQPLPPVFTAFSWTGIYAGVQAGYDWGHDNLLETATAGGALVATYNYHPDGFAGGAHVGANYDFNNIVVGAEVDFEGSTLRGTFLDPGLVGRGSDTINWQGSARGRLGYAIDRLLVYATGGLAFADIKNTYVFIPTNTSESFSSVRTGWTVGGGLDYAITDNWIASVEYRYAQYSKFHNISTVAFPGSTGNQDLTVNMARLGVSYKF